MGLAYIELDQAITESSKQSAENAFSFLEKQKKQQRVEVTEAFSDAVDNKLAELREQTESFDNKSFLSQSWAMAQAVQSGTAKGASEYLPDLGDFGEFMDAADINVSMLIEAIATGDIDALEAKFQAWKDRSEQGLWKASETMEMLILILSDSTGRELIASLPARMLAALPPDKVAELTAYHATQLGMDISVVSGGTALGTLAGGIGGPIACASLLLAANGRKAGKVLEGMINVLSKMQGALKAIRNNRSKPQLYKKDPSIPSSEPDFNTRTFVTPLREVSSNNKQGDENDNETFKCDWKDCKGGHKKKIKYPNDGKLKHSSNYAKKWAEAGLEPWALYGPGKDSKATKEDYLSENKSINLADKAVDTLYPKYPTQKHHVIPVSLFNDYKTLTENSKLAGYDINNKKNGICLPSYVIDIIQHDLQCHRGKHPNNAYQLKLALLIEQLENNSMQYCKNKNDNDEVSKKLIAKLNKISKRTSDLIKDWKYLLRTDAESERKQSKLRNLTVNL